MKLVRIQLVLLVILMTSIVRRFGYNIQSLLKILCLYFFPHKYHRLHFCVFHQDLNHLHLHIFRRPALPLAYESVSHADNYLVHKGFRIFLAILLLLYLSRWHFLALHQHVGELVRYRHILHLPLYQSPSL